MLASGENCSICRKIEKDNAGAMKWFYTMNARWAHPDCYEKIIPCFRTLIEFNEKIIKVTPIQQLNLHLSECFKYSVYALKSTSMIYRCLNIIKNMVSEN